MLQDKRSEHARFCRYAAELMERVSGKPLLMGTDISLARLQRANVVAQTRITFSEKELLLLIRSHLVAKGLHDTANTLVKEANLSVTSLAPPSTPSTPSTSGNPRICRLAGGIAARAAGQTGASPVSSVSASPSARSLGGPHLSCSSSSAFPPHRHGPPAQGSHPVGRILFSRERPAVHPNSGKKLRALKQKSDHGAFIQVSHTFRLLGWGGFHQVTVGSPSCLLWSDSSHEEAAGAAPAFPPQPGQHHHRVPEGAARPLPQPRHHLPPLLPLHPPPLP